MVRAGIMLRYKIKISYFAVAATSKWNDKDTY